MQACIRTIMTTTTPTKWKKKYEQICIFESIVLHPYTHLCIRSFFPWIFQTEVCSILFFKFRKWLAWCDCQLELNTKWDTGHVVFCLSLTLLLLLLQMTFWVFMHANSALHFRNGTLNAANRSWHICNYEICMCMHTVHIGVCPCVPSVALFRLDSCISTWLIICCCC